MQEEEFREGLPKSVVVPETDDAVRQLILQDRHVTYREIESTLRISGTSMHSILHEHLTVAQKNQSIRVAKVLRQLVQTQMQRCIDLNGEYFEKQ